MTSHAERDHKGPVWDNAWTKEKKTWGRSGCLKKTQEEYKLTKWGEGKGVESHLSEGNDKIRKLRRRTFWEWGGQERRGGGGWVKIKTPGIWIVKAFPKKSRRDNSGNCLLGAGKDTARAADRQTDGTRQADNDW